MFSFRDKAKADGDVEKPFLDHLEDLRSTLMKMVSVLLLAMIVAFCFKNQLTRLLERPLKAIEQSQGIDRSQRGERERALKEISNVTVIAVGKVMDKVFTPEERRALAESILQDYKATPGYHELAPKFDTANGSAESGYLQILDVTESFTIALKLAFFAGIGLSFPFQLYFLIDFVLPALTRKERRLLGPGIMAGTVLFLAGVLIGYQYILPKTLVWFHQFGESMNFVSNWKAGTYFSFVTQLCLACGLLCELPLLMVILSMLNILSFQMLQATRRYTVAIILVVVAIIAPTPDPITFLTLALPMLLIFEGSIWLVWLIERKKRAEISG